MQHLIFAASPRKLQPHPAFPKATLASETNGHGGPITFIEAERFFDARAFAVRLFGVSEVSITRIDNHDVARVPCPRWQLRWVGTQGSHENPLRLQRREIFREEEAKDGGPKWRDDR